jgi:RimJ/RimL family protein N-acetyltransferase
LGTGLITTEFKDEKIKEPSECSEKEIEDFYQKVLDGEQVDPFGLRDRIKKAVLLAFHYEENTLVGIAALKRPNETYKKKVFRKAGVSKESDKYNLELGWAYTIKEYRGKGICSSLVQKLISALGSQNIFATTRTDNFPMQVILIKNGFQKTDKPFKRKNSTYNLQLFTRNR